MLVPPSCTKPQNIHSLKNYVLTEIWKPLWATPEKMSAVYYITAGNIA